MSKDIQFCSIGVSTSIKTIDPVREKECNRKLSHSKNIIYGIIPESVVTIDRILHGAKIQGARSADKWKSDSWLEGTTEKNDPRRSVVLTLIIAYLVRQRI